MSVDFSAINESSITDFINVTRANRRAAFWFLRCSSTLNDAISAFLDSGVDSIPMHFNPEGEGECEVEGTVPWIPLVDNEEKSEKGVPKWLIDKQEDEIFAKQSAFCDIDVSYNGEETIKELPKVCGSDRSFILQPPPPQIPQKQEVHQPSKSDKLPIRKKQCRPSLFVIWSNGYTVDDKFHELVGEDYDKLVTELQMGKVPEGVEPADDFQLLNKMDTPHNADADLVELSAI